MSSNLIVGSNRRVPARLFYYCRAFAPKHPRIGGKDTMIPFRKKTGYVSGTQPDESISSREAEHRKLAYEAACEGIVLLENDGALPLAPGKIALYGSGGISTVKGGTGSGEVNERYSVNIYDGLVNAGFSVTSGTWLDEYVTELDRAFTEHDQKCRQAVKDIPSLMSLMDVTNIPLLVGLLVVF